MPTSIGFLSNLQTGHRCSCTWEKCRKAQLWQDFSLHINIYIYIYIHITHVEAALCRQHWALGNALPLRHRGRVNAMGQQIQTRCAVNTRHRATTGHSKTEGASTKCVGTSTRYYKFLFYLVVGFNVPHRQPCAKQILTIPARHADRTIKFYRAGGTSR